MQGYPTLKWFKDGQASEFTGGRTAADVVSWVNKKSGPVPMPANSVEEAKSIKESNPVCVFGFFDSKESDECKTFGLSAEASELTFVVTFSAEVVAEFVVVAPKVVVYTDFDDKVYPYDGAWDQASECIANAFFWPVNALGQVNALGASLGQ